MLSRTVGERLEPTQRKANLEYRYTANQIQVMAHHAPLPFCVLQTETVSVREYVEEGLVLRVARRSRTAASATIAGLPHPVQYDQGGALLEIAPPWSAVTWGRILSSAVEPLAKNAAVSGSRRMLDGSGMAVTPAPETSKATASSAHNGQPCWRLRANAVVDLPTPETAHKATTPLLAAFCPDLPRSAPWPLGRTNAEQPCSSSLDLYHIGGCSHRQRPTTCARSS